jgi:hypothetical protein
MERKAGSYKNGVLLTHLTPLGKNAKQSLTSCLSALAK